MVLVVVMAVDVVDVVEVVVVVVDVVVVVVAVVVVVVVVVVVLQLVSRCCATSWYVPDSQAVHVLMAVLVSPLIFRPLPQVGCVAQLLVRCEAEVW